MIDVDAIRRAHGLIGPSNQVLWSTLVRDFGSAEVLDELEAIWMDSGRPVSSAEVRSAIEKRKAPRSYPDADDDQVELPAARSRAVEEVPSSPAPSEPVTPEAPAAAADVDQVELVAAPPVIVSEMPGQLVPAWTAAEEKRYAEAVAPLKPSKREARPRAPRQAKRVPPAPSPAAKPRRQRSPRTTLQILIDRATRGFLALAKHLRGH